MFVTTRPAEPGGPPSFAFSAGLGEGWRAPSIPPTPQELPIDVPPLPDGIGYEIISARGEGPMLLSYQVDGTALASTWHVLDGWSEPVRVPLPASGGGCPAIDTSGIAWIRRSTDTDGTSRPVAVVLTDRWRFLAEPPPDALTHGILVLAPGHLIVPDALLAYDLGADRWLRLPPLPGGPRAGVSAMWAQGSLVVWGGRREDGSLPGLGWTFRPTPAPGTLDLPGDGRDGYGDCGGVGIDDSIRMRASRSDPNLVWFEGPRERIEAIWPDGFRVRFARRGAIVIAGDGRVVARSGDRLREVRQDHCYGGGPIVF
jgi:hypothetical protein